MAHCFKLLYVTKTGYNKFFKAKGKKMALMTTIRKNTCLSRTPLF